MQGDQKERDANQLRSWGWKEGELDWQLSKLQSGSEPVKAIEPCTIANFGIHRFTEDDRNRALKFFKRSLQDQQRWLRFVPASGAASRMFSGLKAPRNTADEQLLIDKGHELPFWNAHQRRLLETCDKTDRPACIEDLIMDEKEGWSHLPKGLIPFHHYPDGRQQTSFQEHLEEWSRCLRQGKIHFTVPEPFQLAIEQLLGTNQYEWIRTSVQLQSTHTLAWDIEKNELAREDGGNLLLRPGGHGSLLQNLNQIDAAFVSIKNIDNVVPEHRMAMRNLEVSVLMGEAVRLTEERDNLILGLKAGESDGFRKALNWLESFDRHVRTRCLNVDACLELLDRPIRVAGMVPNAGEPGGGPFWVLNTDGSLMPGIVEGAELPLALRGQGTHFNPVDLVCSIHNAEGQPYDLNRFADSNAVFTSEKEWNGRSIRILERPGLWNGSMAFWLTRFVEVPAETFAPVKTTLDLLKPERWQ